MKASLFIFITLVAIIAGIIYFGNTSIATTSQTEQTFALEQARDWHEVELERYRNMTSAIDQFVWIASIGSGVALSIFLLGAAWHGTGYIKMKSSLIFPASTGQKPLVMEQGIGYSIIRDPNIQTASADVVTKPSMLKQAQSLFVSGAALPVSHAPQEHAREAVERAQNIQLTLAANGKIPKTASAPKINPVPDFIDADTHIARDFFVVENGEKRII
jgi:hypothetical protein